MADATAQVLLVGTFHFDNPGRDLVNLQVDDVLTPKRQREIQSVVAALARFEPTKVAGEWPLGDPDVGDRYEAHLAGRHDLRRSEGDQIGYRLAALLGHQQVHALEPGGRFGEDAIDELLRDPRHAARWQEGLDTATRWNRELDAILRSGTVGDALRHLNTPDARAAHLAPYLSSLVPIASQGNWAGPDIVANWYRRNFRIAARIHAIAEPGDRIFVLYGAGHVPVLEHALGLAERVELVDPLPHLADA